MSVLLRLCFSLVILAPALVHAATLENPRNGSFYSGIGVISGWKCTATGQLTVRFNDGDSIPLAYGNVRADVRNAGACPSAQVGFVSIMNWAELGDGTHTAVVYDNGVEFARSTFTVATTGDPYVTGAEGECRVPDFPAPGETMAFAWNEATQHLEMVGDSDERRMLQASSSSGGSGGPAALENPASGSFYSGIGVISGWKCTAIGQLTVRFNGGDPIPLAYGNVRGDVRNAGACPSAQVGFVSIMNWAELGDGEHTAVVYDNGVEFARSTFTVATTGEPFVTGAEGECRVPDFPAPDETMRFAWNEATQHLEMVGDSGDEDGGDVCNRTPAVRDAIVSRLRYLNRASCEDITAEDLAGITSLHLDGIGLSSLRTGDFAGLSALERLDLDGNALTILPPGVFAGLSALKSLNLDGNALTILPSGVFADLSALEWLDLSENALTILPSGVFAGLSALERLDLSENALTTLPSGVFAGLSALRLLVLLQNALTTLPSGVFAGLSTLETLDLYGNALTTLPSGVFADLSALDFLGLGGNALTTLPPGVFAGLSALTGLSLAANQLTSLPPDVFAGLSGLEDLNLGENALTILPPDVFAGLSGLEDLDLSHNALTTLPPGVFAGLSGLEDLDLSHNALTTLPPGVFADLPPNARINLWGNPL